MPQAELLDRTLTPWYPPLLRKRGDVPGVTSFFCPAVRSRFRAIDWGRGNQEEGRGR